MIVYATRAILLIVAAWQFVQFANMSTCNLQMLTDFVYNPQPDPHHFGSSATIHRQV